MVCHTCFKTLFECWFVEYDLKSWNKKHYNHYVKVFGPNLPSHSALWACCWTKRKRNTERGRETKSLKTKQHSNLIQNIPFMIGMFTPVRRQSFRYVTCLTCSPMFPLRINFWDSWYTTFVSSTFPCSSTTTNS